MLPLCLHVVHVFWYREDIVKMEQERDIIQAGSEAISEERINYNALASLFNIDLTSFDYKIGVVDFCDYRDVSPKVRPRAFINHGFGKSEAIEKNMSVIFKPTLARTVPDHFKFDTRNNIYLVLFAVSGTVPDTKSGIEHPKFDYSVPIRVIRALPRKTCAYIKISDDGAILELVKLGMLAERHDQQFTSTDAEELDSFYSSARYVEFLSSDCFRRLKPNEIPLRYMEKALTAARRLIFSPDEQEVHLNPFQQKLLQAESKSDFAEWSSETRYNSDILNMCRETMMPAEPGVNTARMLNEIVHNKYSRADQYMDSGTKKTMGLISRFQAVRNEQLLPLYVIGAFSQTDPGNINTLIVNLCRFIQEINNESNLLLRNSGEDRVLYLPSVLRTILRAPAANGVVIEHGVQTLILSAFVRTFSVKELDDEFVNRIFQNLEGSHHLLIDLIRHHDTWDENKFLLLVSTPNLNLQLLERSVALVWGEYSGQSSQEDASLHQLPKSVLLLLSWVVTHCNRDTLDATIDYPSMRGNKKLSRKVKCFSLLCALPDIRALTEEYPSSYNLGVYLVNYLYKELEETSSADLVALGIDRYVSDWRNFSQTRFEERKPSSAAMSPERKALYGGLFREYWQDRDRELLLQQMYAEELLAAYEESSAEQLLAECFAMKAYGAYAALCRRILDEGRIALNEDFQDGYVKALIQMQAFAELMDFLLENSDMEENARNRYLVETVCGVFSAYHYSPAAFTIFSEKFTVQDAIKLLWDHMMPNKFPLITSLIALYINQGEFFKARFLYAIFHIRAEIGNTRIYFQFLKMFDNSTNHILRVGSEDNHYDVIQTAFYVLTPQKILEFLSWASEIKIPDMANYNPQHTHILALSRILEEPNNTLYWQEFLKHLSTKLTRFPLNAWLVCVCDGVLSSVWNLTHSFDVRRAYDLVLSQMQDPNQKARYFPVNLMSYACDYIIRKGDEQLCQSLCSVIGDEQRWDRLSIHNPWAKDQLNRLSAFSSYCVQKLRETGSKVYSDLLKITAPSVSVDNLLAIASAPGSTAYLIRQICGNYLEGRQLGETRLLVEQIDRSKMSFREIEAMDLLRMAYSDETELEDRHPEIWKSEEEIYQFKQDCMQILQYYPATDGVRLFEESNTDTRYKRLVYSYISGVFYSKELYDRYAFDYDAFKHRVDQVIIASYLRKVFFAQLIYNTSYAFFYKRWRYLRLYITLAIEAEGPADASGIISVMKAHGHDDSVLEDYFDPFKQAVDSYLALPTIDIEEKKVFLYCIMLGKHSDYLDEYADTFPRRTEEETQHMKRIVSLLDYRDISYTLYQFYGSELQAGNFQRAKWAAAALLPTALDALSALESLRGDPDAYALFQKVFKNIPAQCVNAMIKLDDRQYNAYHDLIDPLVCSRQLPYQLYGRFRSLVLDKNERGLFDRYASLIKYLGEKVDPNAPMLFLYLKAIQAANNGEREAAAALVREIGPEMRQLPVLWRDESDELRQYAAGEREDFHASKDLFDASMEDTAVDAPFHFFRTILDRLEPDHPDAKLTKDELLTAWRRFRDKSGNISERERIIAGARVLGNDKTFRELTKKGAGLSQTLNDFALDVGLFVLNAKSHLPITADDRVEIVADLIEHNLGGGDLYPLFDDLFDDLLQNSDCSLECWCRHRETIRYFVSDTQYRSDAVFPWLCEEVINPCARLLRELADRQCSQEELYEELEKLNDKLRAQPVTGSALDSPLSRSLLIAINNRIKEIKDNVRLAVTIERSPRASQLVVTDGYVYFFIENVGSRSVSLEDCEIQFQGLPLPIKLEDSITMLHPQFVTGGRAKLSGAPDTDITVQIQYQDMILCRDQVAGKDILNSRLLNTIELNTNRGDLYAVDKAIKVFGREENVDRLKYLIEDKGKALIYGPSRIGKTSVLDELRKPNEDDSHKRKNTIIITFAGGDDGRDSDYEEILESFEHAGPGTEKPRWIEEYILVDSILKALGKPRRMTHPATYTKDNEKKIRDILQGSGTIKDRLQSSDTIKDRYEYLDVYLQEQDMELWLILDEFQKIVTAFEPIPTSQFAKVFAFLNGTSNIKLIMCGSDDLLKHMVLKRESAWRRLINPQLFGVQIKPLDEGPFCDMICTEPLESGRSIEKIGLAYSEKALTALYRYTGGIPLYGKQICNQVLRTLSANGELEVRNTIYSSDIAQATQILINSQQNERSGEMFAIYDAVTKNLNKDTDELFLTYIARYIMRERKIGCPYSAFTQNDRGPLRLKADGDEPFKELDDSLAIAEARGIIRKVDPNASVPVYTFCTVFYYNAFLANSYPHLEDKLFARESNGVIEESRVDQLVGDYLDLSPKKQVDALDTMYKALPPEERLKAIKGMWGDEDNDAVIKPFRKKFFQPQAQTVIHTGGGDVVSGDKNDYHINIQSITNTFATLLNGDTSSQTYLEAFGNLPSLSMFIPRDSKTLLSGKIKTFQEKAKVFDMLNEEGDGDNCNEAELAVDIATDEVEEITRPAEQSMVGATFAAAMDLNDFFNVTADRWKDLIGISKTELEQRLPSEFVTSLSSAVMLHNVFEAIRVKCTENGDAQEKAETEIDYCPVAIMYCKVVEAMLKELHTPIYVSRIGDATIKEKNGRQFINLIDKDGMINKADKDLTIGSFSFSIVATHRDNDIDEPETFYKKEKWPEIKQITGEDRKYETVNELWREHALALAVIQGVRNKSAHEAAPITRKNFEWLIETLFEDGEILRIADLGNRQYPCN